MTGHRCRCGSRSPDAGLLGDHVLDALADGADPGAHGYEDEPQRVVAARAVAVRRRELRQQLEQATGMSVADIREAMR